MMSSVNYIHNTSFSGISSYSSILQKIQNPAKWPILDSFLAKMGETEFLKKFYYWISLQCEVNGDVAVCR